jgi:hypothetical protein
MKSLRPTLLALLALVMVSEWPVPSDAFDWSRNSDAETLTVGR